MRALWRPWRAAVAPADTLLGRRSARATSASLSSRSWFARARPALPRHEPRREPLRLLSLRSGSSNLSRDAGRGLPAIWCRLSRPVPDVDAFPLRRRGWARNAFAAPASHRERLRSLLQRHEEAAAHGPARRLSLS